MLRHRVPDQKLWQASISNARNFSLSLRKSKDMFSKKITKNTLNTLKEKIKSSNEANLKEDFFSLYKKNIFTDASLEFPFMPEIEDMIDVAERRKIHFLAVYVAIMEMKLRTRFECQDCGKLFANRSQLQTHENMAHAKENQENVKPNTSE